MYSLIQLGCFTFTPPFDKEPFFIVKSKKIEKLRKTNRIEIRLTFSYIIIIGVNLNMKSKRVIALGMAIFMIAASMTGCGKNRF